MFASMDLGRYELQGEVRLLSAANEEQRRRFKLTGGRLEGEMVVRGDQIAIDEDGERALEFSDGEQLFLDFEFNPSDRVSGR